MSVKGAMEQMAEAEPLEALQAERLELAEKIAPLHARYGPSGTFSERRQNLLSALQLQHRPRLEASMSKVTEAMVEAASRYDERYGELLAEAEAARAELFLLEIKMKNLDERFTRDTQACRFASETARLGG